MNAVHRGQFTSISLFIHCDDCAMRPLTPSLHRRRQRTRTPCLMKLFSEVPRLSRQVSLSTEVANNNLHRRTSAVIFLFIIVAILAIFSHA